jgi:putative membrane protein insertion efficiency factor
MTRGRAGAIACSAALLALIAHDVAVPPRRELGTTAAVWAVERYREFLSPGLGAVVTCRFKPTCSLYGLTVLRRDGLLRGGLRTASRIVRCNPSTPPGTVENP